MKHRKRLYYFGQCHVRAVTRGQLNPLHSEALMLVLQRYMGTVRSAFPDTRFFALRTDSQIRIAPRHARDSKRWSWLNHPSTNAYISQMNAVLRHMAAAEDMPLVDFERIAMQLPQASDPHLLLQCFVGAHSQVYSQRSVPCRLQHATPDACISPTTVEVRLQDVING